MRRLNLAELNRLRAIPGRTLLLFVTHRCPVGCGHCSVDSRRDSATIADYPLFEALVEGICAQPELEAVGISGGEPFVERRGLTLAVERLAAAGKAIVPYTSGVWAGATVPRWVREVLRPASCVVLSTDAYHAAAIDDERFVRAARTIAEEGAWLIVQVLRTPAMVGAAERLLRLAFGERHADYAELSLTSPLPYGRGAALFARRPGRPGETFGACGGIGSPVVRFDGAMTACCNEQVIMGLGPARLRRHCASAEEVTAGIAHFERDPLLCAIGGVGAGAATLHPRFADLARREFSNICELCWAMQERLAGADNTEGQPDRLLMAMAALATRGPAREEVAT